MADGHRVKPVDYIVLHHAVSDRFINRPKADIEKWFSDIGRNRGYAGKSRSYHNFPKGSSNKGETFSQAHFALHEYTKDGNKYGWRLVPLMDDVWNNVAWHAGNWPVNQRSIGVEVCGRFDQGRILPDKALMLIADYFRGHDKNIGGKLQITAHKQFSATACPGSIYGKRAVIIDMINNSGKWNSKLFPKPIPKPDPVDWEQRYKDLDHEYKQLEKTSKQQYEKVKKELNELKAKNETLTDTLNECIDRMEQEPASVPPQGFSLGELAIRLTSRKFISALLAAVLPILNARFGWGLEIQEVLVIIMSLLAYLGFEGSKDIVDANKDSES